ncbi:hypothetical protein FAQ76_04970 [Klebsiella pneumoniae subsp. pneumoniae]|nr:hypothetical protein CI679_15095 [Klebsiella pneumoniae subsp. pneumoniae]THL27637.1 hypothetical protein FAM68_06235 [Klebsiella pneumoniae]OYF97914.1 hypothetical protein CI681_06885 [Klebsiella pneumoniae subsp. pneumoniae]THL32145.1 hypothetical protein FAN06_06140 [Klebsiella pneumoniae subsp. pneumoniae]THL62661.1 hypothetical protein FAM99_08855 [Klebsiella pneumoniae subsp. pneumoniae]
MRRRRGFAILRLKLKRFWRRPQAGDDWQIFSANYTRYRHTFTDNTHSIARLAIFDSMARCAPAREPDGSSGSHSLAELTQGCD